MKEIKAIVKPIFTKMFNENFSVCDFGIECCKKGMEYQGIKELKTEAERLANGNLFLTQQLSEKDKQLSEAREIIREFIDWANWQGNGHCPSFKSIQNKAEQFLRGENDRRKN